METNISISIDIISKLRKINEGKTFSDNLVVITELLQNSQRAGAKNVYIDFGDGKLIFKDDGCGCKAPMDILTLDQSNWESTNEGFGIGLWSWLAVTSVEGIEVRSNTWKISLTTKQIFVENNIDATLEIFEDKIKGFEVTIFSSLFSNVSLEIQERIISDGEMQLFNTYLNGALIPKKDLHSEVEGDFKMTFNNKYFNTTLVPSSWAKIKSYYERRLIDNFYPTDYVDGVIEVKKDALTLQEPDRKNVIRDEKRHDFINKLEECRRELYLNIVKKGDSCSIDKYASQIDRILDVEEYEKYLLVDDLVLEVEEESRNVENFNPMGKFNSFKKLVEVIEGMNSTTQLSLTDNRTEEYQQEIIRTLLNKSSDTHRWVKTNELDLEVENLRELTEKNIEEVLDNVSSLSIGGVIYKKVDVSDFKEMFADEDEELISSIIVKTTKEKKKKDTLKSVLKKTNRKVWVKANEVEEYSDLIAKIEYYGVKVFIAKNVLHENVFRENNISYITEIESGIQKTNIKWDIELKTKKEERFIELLQPICYYYNLPMNTFKIGNLKLMIETILDERVINREIIENRKDSIKIYGVTDSSDIILDRRALGLQRFNLSGNNIGVNELKVLMASMKTISHELAHLIYGTEDNTKDHRIAEDRIYEELVNLYLTL